MYYGIPVKINFFRKVFNTEYNLGFGNPRTDVCSTCLQGGERIKTCTDPNVKTALITELRVHKLRAPATAGRKRKFIDLIIRLSEKSTSSKDS